MIDIIIPVYTAEKIETLYRQYFDADKSDLEFDLG